MIKSRFILLPLLGCMTVLAGCSAMGGGSCLKPPAAEDTGDLPPLRIPVGLDAPDTRTALKVPALDQPAAPASRSGCLEDPPQIVALAAPTDADREKSKKESAKSGKGRNKGKRAPGRPGL